MQIIADFLLMAASICACFYCWMLSQRLQKLKSTRKGIAASLASLSKSVEEAKKAIAHSHMAAEESVARLAPLVEEAKGLRAELAETTEVLQREGVAAMRHAAAQLHDASALASARPGAGNIGGARAAGSDMSADMAADMADAPRMRPASSRPAAQGPVEQQPAEQPAEQSVGRAPAPQSDGEGADGDMEGDMEGDREIGDLELVWRGGEKGERNSDAPARAADNVAGDAAAAETPVDAPVDGGDDELVAEPLVEERDVISLKRAAG